MSCGIYKITNKINNKIYIGKALNIERRWAVHKFYTSHEAPSYAIYNAIHKYGLENFLFEIIEECPLNSEILSQREQYWITYYHSFEEGYNETRGGEGVMKYNYNKIRELWDEGLSCNEIKNEINCSDYVIQNALKGYSNYCRSEISKRFQNSKEYREYRRQIALINKKSKPVYQYSLEGEYLNEYRCVADADRALGKKLSGNISLVLQGKRKQCYGFLWSYDKKERITPYKRKNSCWIKNKETQKIFTSLTEAANWANVNRTTLKRACAANKPCGAHPETEEKLTWEFITEENYE